MKLYEYVNTKLYNLNYITLQSCTNDYESYGFKHWWQWWSQRKSTITITITLTCRSTNRTSMGSKNPKLDPLLLIFWKESFMHSAHTHSIKTTLSVHDPEQNLKSNLIYLITSGLGHKSQMQQSWEVLGIFHKTHYEEYHRNPEVADHWEDLPSEKGNNPYLID